MMQPQPGPWPAPWWEARQLLRAARVATLATQSGGQPHASLVTPATAPDGSVLLLLSGLSAHTRQLRSDPRCALLVQGAPDGPNPQASPRLTVTGLAAPEPDQAMRDRWLAVHPYAAFYAGLDDFSVWRVTPAAGHFVGGFARAFPVAAADLAPPADAVAAIAAAASRILDHVNADHADALRLIAARQQAEAPAWQMVTVDADGCDLAAGDLVRRIAWSAPVQDAGGVRTELVRLTQDARGTSQTAVDTPPGSG